MADKLPTSMRQGSRNPPPAPIRNPGHADRLSLMPPVPPTPANPNTGSGSGSRSGSGFGMSLFTQTTPTKKMFSAIPRRLGSDGRLPSVTGVINSRVTKSVIPGKKKRMRSLGRMGDLSIAMSDGGATHSVNESFRFLDLPPEIRNEIYSWAVTGTKQALLVHCPRMASLRPRTRQDRCRPLPDYDPEAVKPKGKKAPIPRESHRPFFGLTQVSRQVRSEFYSIYLKTQEIGLDLTDVVRYLLTVYNWTTLTVEQDGLMKDLPFKGNLTIAVSSHILPCEKNGIEMIFMLHVWANSIKMEAGFGRYQCINYQPLNDGEAKDLYRLFGRSVLPDRSCSRMNNIWRSYLRGRRLASVSIHRAPAPIMVQPLLPSVFAAPSGSVPYVPNGPVPLAQKPYFHIQFKPQYAEPWMRTRDSPIPAGWLEQRGFGNMEHFKVKVGVYQPGRWRRQ